MLYGRNSRDNEEDNLTLSCHNDNVDLDVEEIMMNILSLFSSSGDKEESSPESSEESKEEDMGEEEK